MPAPISPVTSEILAGVSRQRITGPFAEETADSRVGLSVSLQGADRVTRKWRVYCSSPVHNPLTVIQSLGIDNGGVRLGDDFPPEYGWGDRSFKLFSLSISEHWPGTGAWVLLGTYVPGSVYTLPTDQWSFTIRSSLEQEKVYQTPPFLVDPTDPSSLIPSKGIGSPLYVESNAFTVGGSPTSLFESSDIEGNRKFYRLAGSLSENPFTPGLPRYRVGADAAKRTSVLTLTKTISHWSGYEGAVRSAVNLKKTINSDAFIVQTNAQQEPIEFVSPAPDFGRGTVLFDDFNVTPISNPTGGLFPSFRVTFSFKINPDGWQLKLQHVARIGGVQYPIRYTRDGFTSFGRPFKAQDIVEEEFLMNLPTSLSAIVGAFT